MQVGTGDNTFKWIDDWAKAPASESAKAGWAHHGVVVSESGEIITYHQDDRRFLVYDKDGGFLRSWDVDLTEAHGITLVQEHGTEYLWIADTGAKRGPALGYEYPEGGEKVTGRVVKMTLEGDIVTALSSPPLEVYGAGDYKPTWVAVNEERNGGNGDVWVADGYGANYIHRYDSNGGYVGSLNGEEGQTGRFDCPHAIVIDTRKSEPELYVADRANARVQVYSAEGEYRRAFGSDFLTSPSGFVIHGDLMIVAELRARLTIVDAADNFVCYLGQNDAVADVEGWPNNKNERGQPVRTSLLETGKFNSPHGMAVDGSGNLYIEEWLIGGRFIKLKKV